ncbi:uncharacterized protein LOC109836884 [Asparagus officinalis]|uniref:uncharacterized protein LOC109836884 n=1 Tax=Asparagus officinalis TaxID=4686 RepID=UPI00098E61B4|nr:uncharacterized protein LOC109836884 [Asparagus officinalis]XP_020260515.1 uncharacterized protein LOC109836884 [Asparagus officinalis]
MNVKCKGGGGGGSEGEDGYIFQSPSNANGISSRKRIKLQKVSGDRCPVDPALVPRRVRSAMKNRISQSASPPLSDTKKQHHAFVGTQLFKGSSSEGFKQRMLDEVTKDEEEVAEALTSMANFITTKPVKTAEDGGRISEENLDKKAILAPCLEAPEEESIKLLIPCNDTKTSDPLEEFSPTVKADPSTPGQPVAVSVSQKLDIEANGDLLNPLRRKSSNMEQAESFIDAMSLSNPVGAPQHLPVNGTLQPNQLDSGLVLSKEIGLWPLGPASLKPQLVMPDGEKAPSVQPGSYSRVHEQLKMPSLCKVDVSGRCGRVNGLLMEKLPLASIDKKQHWSRCITHVNISRLIQHHQKAEKKQLPTPQLNQVKPMVAINQSLPTSCGTSGSRNGMIPQLSNGSLIERNMLEARNRMLQDGGRLQQAQQAAALPGAYAQQKQGCDFLSLSAVGDTKISGNGMKSSGQLLVPYPPNQGVMPFTYSRGSYTSQYQEQFAAGASQQVQLHLPAYMSNSQLYGQHMGQAAGGAATQQQLMWQAHLAHYRPPVNFTLKWQDNGRQHESSSSSSSLVQNPPSIFPLPADNSSHNIHQPFVMPLQSLSSLSSRSKQKQQHNGSGLNPRSSSQLPMICNAESFR